MLLPVGRSGGKENVVTAVVRERRLGVGGQALPTGQIGQLQGLCRTVRSTLADDDPLAVSHAGVGAFRAQRGSETTPQWLVVLTRAERGGAVLLR